MIRVLQFIIITLVASHTLWAQQISFAKEYKIEDGVLEREIRDLIRTRKGEFFILYNTGIQTYSDYRYKTIISKRKLTSYERLGLGSDETVYLLSPSPFHYAFLNQRERTLITRKPNRENGITHLSFFTNGRIINAQLEQGEFKIADQVQPLSIDNWEEISFVSKWDDDVFIQKGDRLFIMSNGSLQQTINDVHSCYEGYGGHVFYISNNGFLFDIQASGETKVLDSLTYKKIVIGHSPDKEHAIGTMLDANHFDEILVIEDDTILRQTSFQEITNRMTSFCANSFTQQTLFGTHEGLLYIKYADIVQNYLSDYNASLSDFKKVIRATFFRPEDSVLIAAQECGRVFALDANEGSYEFEFSRRYIDSSQCLNQALYDSQNDMLYVSQSTDVGKSTLIVYDFSSGKTRTSYTNLIHRMELHNGYLWTLGRKNNNPVFQKRDKTNFNIHTQYELPKAGRDFLFADDQMYIATPKGVLVCPHPTEKQVRIQPIDTLLPNSFILFVTELNGMLAIGTMGNGAYLRSTEGELIHIDNRNGLQSLSCAWITQDERKNYWLGTFNTITVIDSNYNFITNFGINEGLCSSECNTHAMDSKNGELLIGTINGISRFHMYNLLQQEPTHAIYPSSVNYTQNGIQVNKKVNDDPKITIPYGVHSITINFTVLDYPNPTQYDYTHHYEVNVNRQLDTIFQTNVEVHLKVKNRGMHSMEVKRTFDGRQMVVKDFYFETFWDVYKSYIYILLVSLLFLSGLLFLWMKRWQDRRIKSKLRYENEINKLKLSSLLSQMNPHFIFNALSSIQYYIQKKENREAEKYLADFAKLMRLILDSSKTDLIELSEEIELISLYVRLEQLRFDQLFDFKLVVDPLVDEEFEIPSMIIQPFIENAIIHGLQHLEEKKGLLLVRITSPDDDTLEIFVRDNGIGRDKAQTIKQHKPHKSMGIQLIYDRIHLLEKEKAISIDIRITDLYGDDKSPSGTEVYYKIQYL